MTATYLAMMVTRPGGPEVLESIALPLEDPGPGQLRVRVKAAGVGSTDLLMLTGTYMYAPKIPFVPGYEIAGVVDAIGAGVSGFAVGQRVAALTVHGGFSEMLVRDAGHFLPIPDAVCDIDAAAVILNYVTAWQMIHRTTKVSAGQTALVTGAAGGVGTAALQLLLLAGVRTYGAASAQKHGTLRRLGAVPLDYHAGTLDSLVREFEPDGVDHSFDAIGGANISQCIAATRRGGTVVGYGFLGVKGRLATVAMFLNLFIGARLRGRIGRFYGITLLYRKDPKPLQEDLPKIFSLVADKQVDPLVRHILPMSAARQALEMLAAGTVQGKLVLTNDPESRTGPSGPNDTDGPRPVERP
jgi:NADPH:quinone reductase-like Zn-dependent oxidoreductase